MGLYTIKSINEVLSGEIVLHPIYRSDGLLFLSRYKTMTTSILHNLRRHYPPDVQILTLSNIADIKSFEESGEYQNEKFLADLETVVEKFSLYMTANLTIKDYKDEKAFVKDVITPNTNIFEKFYYSPLWNQFELIFDSLHILNRIPKIKEALFATLKKETSLEKLYLNMRNYHDVLKVHSMNSSILSLMIGLSLELSDEELIELAVAAMFADIGFTEYPKSEFVIYLNHGKKKDILSKHIKQSVNMISTSEFCRRKNVMMGILDHHERIDGSGLPNKKHGKDIHLFGKIISIAQSYDELVGGYVEEKGIASYQAFQYIWDQKGILFDEEIIKIFLYRTTIFKVNDFFLMSNFQKGKIVGFHDFVHYPLLPKIKMEDGFIRDLYKEKTMKDSQK